MSEHRTNPVAIANAVPKQIMNALDLGGGAAILGVQIVPVLDEKRENVVIVLVGVGGRKSDLIPLIPKPVILAELAKIPIAQAQKAFLGGAPEPATSPAVEPGSSGAVDGAPDTSKPAWYEQ